MTTLCYITKMFVCLWLKTQLKTLDCFQSVISVNNLQCVSTVLEGTNGSLLGYATAAKSCILQVQVNLVQTTCDNFS